MFVLGLVLLYVGGYVVAGWFDLRVWCGFWCLTVVLSLLCDCLLLGLCIWFELWGLIVVGCLLVCFAFNLGFECDWRCLLVWWVVFMLFGIGFVLVLTCLVLIVVGCAYAWQFGWFCCGFSRCWFVVSINSVGLFRLLVVVCLAVLFRFNLVGLLGLCGWLVTLFTDDCVIAVAGCVWWCIWWSWFVVCVVCALLLDYF